MNLKKPGGKRKLEDNWRWSSQIELNSTAKNTTQTPKKSDRYNLASYLKRIPTDPKVIDTLKRERNQALYELGNHL
jgi:hypothetical protein